MIYTLLRPTPFIRCLFFLLLVVLVSCKPDGTATGNPFRPPVADHSTPPWPISVLVNWSCDKITSCYSDLSKSDCVSGLKNQRDIDVEIGLEEQRFESLADAINFEKANAPTYST
ncbi:MAG: hypothetical protein COT74_08515 [Bdellovibrionales bacterium CG10_big_fil_rev_8_21_14_0_10_45_34]|nr:MAG: hypothetical protein COT74_08515 [Bdellovibrionales bacterium CG10_big_fil_rev_8_21_14_0_10_45_34]